MPLQLDTRQRAMLLEMGVHVWLPGTDFGVQATTAETAAEASPASTPPSVRPNATATTATTRNLASLAASASPAVAALKSAGAANDLGQIHILGWAALQQTAAQCQACGLCAGRTQSTLSRLADGQTAQWMVVGDPPDEDEDAAGHAFPADAGVLLDNMLKAVGAARISADQPLAPDQAGALLANVTACRPPNGRNPQPAELVQCAAYLQRQIALAQPKVILAMGRFATQLLLAEHPDALALPLGKQRGTVYRYQGIPVVVTYAPKALLRNSADKGKAWADLCLAVEAIAGAA
ncbi:MAG: uracil-DNA glycosylase [Rhodoferax sp.]|nr:uracil-DNA glycosylase [Rhodoferax sp.]